VGQGPFFADFFFFLDFFSQKFNFKKNIKHDTLAICHIPRSPGTSRTATRAFDQSPATFVAKHGGAMAGTSLPTSHDMFAPRPDASVMNPVRVLFNEIQSELLAAKTLERFECGFRPVCFTCACVCACVCVFF
jgi:hypothetical protein